MVAATLVPAIALLEAGVLEGAGPPMTIEHVVMLGATFLVMIARPDECSHASVHTRDVTATA